MSLTRYDLTRDPWADCYCDMESAVGGDYYDADEVDNRIKALETAFDKAMDMLAEAHAGTEKMSEVDALRNSLTKEFDHE